MLTRHDISIWLINLPRSGERLAAMQQQLEQLNLKFTVFSAVDGKTQARTLMHTVDENAYERNMGSRLLPGKIGCYHSHIGVWTELLDSNKKAALILEDDIVFHENFLDGLDTALAASNDWDTVRFNCIRAKIPVTQKQLGDYKLNAYIGPFTGNGSYLLKRDVARRLLPNLLPMTRAFDHELNRFYKHNFRQLGLEPFCSHADDGNESTITGTGFSDLEKFKGLRRMPHYWLKAMNYFRRFFWLLRNGYLTSRKTG